MYQIVEDGIIITPSLPSEVPILSQSNLSIPDGDAQVQAADDLSNEWAGAKIDVEPYEENIEIEGTLGKSKTLSWNTRTYPDKTLAPWDDQDPVSTSDSTAMKDFQPDSKASPTNISGRKYENLSPWARSEIERFQSIVETGRATIKDKLQEAQTLIDNQLIEIQNLKAESAAKSALLQKSRDTMQY